MLSTLIVAVGAVLIAIVMFAAALIPRPSAEYAIAQVPWQARSPAGLSSSQHAMGNDAPKDQEQQPEPGQVVDELNGKIVEARKGGGEIRHGQRPGANFQDIEPCSLKVIDDLK